MIGGAACGGGTLVGGRSATVLATPVSRPSFAATAAACARGQGGDKRSEISDVVNHMPTHHHIRWPSLFNQIGPAAEQQPHQHIEPLGTLSERLQ